MTGIGLASIGRLFAAALALQLAACGRSPFPPGNSDAGADVRADKPGVSQDARTTGDVRDTDARDARDPDARDARDTDASPTCPSQRQVTFQMRAQQSEPPVDYFYISSLGDPGDGDWWYSIATADGTPFAIFPFQWTCGSCTGAPIPIGAGCSLLPAGGVTATWNGEAVTGVSTCQTTEANGETATLGCDTTRCMPAGQYIVTMCATASPSSCLERGTDAGQTCVSVPFDYPTASVVVGELPP